MLQLLPQNDVLMPDTSDPKKAAEYINAYIDSVRCENMSVDISFMNIPDACYVSTLCSTHHYIKYPAGKINWLVSSNSTEKFCRSLQLGNSEFIYTK